MNNFFVNQDPLLAHPQPIPYPIPMIDNVYQQPIVKDWIGDLDKQLKGLNEDTVKSLYDDEEFVELNSALQATIQDELLNLIRNRLNTHPFVIDNVKKQMDIVSRVENRTKENERKSMNELNDYIKNYSNLTFDEYKKMKMKNEGK